MSSQRRVAAIVFGLILAVAVVAVVRQPQLSASIAALAAIITASVSSAALAQVRKDSRNSARPMVAAQLRQTVPLAGAAVDEHTLGIQDLVIRNFGSTVASSVVVEFKPNLPRTEALVRLVDLYSRPIPTLVPGDELTNIYAYTDDRSGAPDQVVVKISYIGPDGTPYGPELYPLDVRVLRNRTAVGVK